MNEDMLRILKMIEDKKITLEQGKNLIDAICGSKRVGTRVEPYENKFLKIRVMGAQGDKVKVNLPVKLMKEAVKQTGKGNIKKSGLEKINLSEVMDTVVYCVENEVVGAIVDVESTEGDRVKIVIE